MTGTPAAQKLVKAQQTLIDEDVQRPLRIRGHLFFDASHGLCKGNAPTSGNPPRRPVGRFTPSTELRCASSSPTIGAYSVTGRAGNLGSVEISYVACKGTEVVGCA